MDKERANKISKILSEVDPMNLVDIGAPDNEYDPEAEAIEKYIEVNGFVNLERAIDEIFLYYFSESISSKYVKEIADRAIKLK